MLNERYFSHDLVLPFLWLNQSRNVITGLNDSIGTFSISANHILNSAIESTMANVIEECQKNNNKVLKINSSYRSYHSQLKLYLRLLNQKKDFLKQFSV